MTVSGHFAPPASAAALAALAACLARSASASASFLFAIEVLDSLRLPLFCSAAFFWFLARASSRWLPPVSSEQHDMRRERKSTSLCRTRTTPRGCRGSPNASQLELTRHSESSVPRVGGRWSDGTEESNSRMQSKHAASALSAEGSVTAGKRRVSMEEEMKTRSN